MRKQLFTFAVALGCLLLFAPLGAEPMIDGSIFDTSKMRELEIVELQQNGYFKTYFAHHNEALVLVTDYRTTSIVSKGTRITGTFLFVTMRKVLYRGTEYELPVYAVYPAGEQANDD